MTPLEIFASADDVLQDASYVRWPQAERLRHLNDGRRAMAVVRPDLYARVETVTLVAGTKQTLPANGFRFFDATRNINTDNTPGAAVRVIEREALDALRPNWHADAAGPIKHFMLDERTPNVFYVYPQAAANQKLEISYAENPAVLLIANVSTDQLTQEGVYAGLLADYVIHRAYLKDSEFAGNAALSQQHYQLFMAGLTLGGKRGLTTSPNMANVGGVPSRVAAAEGV
jgi:hypothetical protein